jgi:hypothetical protein
MTMKRTLLISLLLLPLALAADETVRLQLSGMVNWQPTTSSPTPDILWWQLNEGSSTSITGDGTIGGDDGTTDADWVTGKSGSGYALDFDGSSDDASTSSNITFGTNVVTVAMWVYFDATNNTRMLIEGSDNAVNNANTFSLFVEGGYLQASIRSTTAGQFRIERIIAPATGAWHHVLVVFDNSTNTGNEDIWLNGVSQSTSTYINTKTTNGVFAAYRVYVGARNTNLTYTDGRIDDVRIYSGDRSASVADIYADPR